VNARIAIIPARGNSRRIYKKNIALFHGKPIIAYSIETALACNLFDAVIVSTDSQEIADIAQIYGAVALMRDAEHSEDHVGTQDVARNVLDELKENGHAFAYACVIYPTAPMMTPGDLIAGYTEIEASGAGFVMSVGDAPLADAGQWYWGVPDYFGVDPLISTRTTMYPIPKERVCDVNHPDDWAQAEAMYKKWKGI
jgi:N-acylneuraminate cytidylyltransferase